MSRLFRHLRLWALAVVLPVTGVGQTLSPAFQAPDLRVRHLQALPILVKDVVPDGQGRLLVGGRFDFVGPQPCGNLTRLLPDGPPDPAFNPGGSGTNGTVQSLVALPNGQWLVGGTFTRYNGVPVRHLIRLAADGALDATFDAAAGGGPPVPTAGTPKALALDSHGRYLVAGVAYYVNGAWIRGLVRLLPTGAVDPTFRPDSAALGVWSYIERFVVDSADRVVCNVPYPGTGASRVVRLQPTGAVDTTLRNSDGRVIRYNTVVRLRQLPHGRLLIMNDDVAYAPDQQPAIVRLYADGALDSTFRVPPTICARYGAAVLPNGQLVIDGQLRLNTDGSVDTTYARPTLTPVARYPGEELIQTVVPSPGLSALVLVGGRFTAVNGQPAIGLVRLTATGAPDATFQGPAFGQRAAIRGLARQSGGRLLAFTSGARLQGQTVAPVVRLSASGVIDRSFRPDSATMARFGAPFDQLAVDAADRVLVSARTNVIRLLPNGSHDPTFSTGWGATQSTRAIEAPYIRCFVVQPDGKVLVGGDFMAYNKVMVSGLVRLTSSGAPDSTFTPPFVDHAIVLGIELLPNATMLVQYHGARGEEIYWLNANGVPLASFNGGQPLSGAGLYVRGLPDNSALFATSTWHYPGAYPGAYPALTNVRKLNDHGIVDTSFVLDPALAGATYQLFVQPDGRLLAYNHAVSSYTVGDGMLRLTATGALDPTFAPLDFGSGRHQESVNALLFADNGDLLVGGAFTTLNGALHAGLVRLTDVLAGGRADAPPAPAAFDLYPNPSRNALTLRRALPDDATATLVDVLGRSVREWTLTAAEQPVSLAGIPAGTYVVRVAGAPRLTARRVVVQP